MSKTTTPEPLTFTKMELVDLEIAMELRIASLERAINKEFNQDILVIRKRDIANARNILSRIQTAFDGY